jgi:hypothetical protein
MRVWGAVLTLGLTFAAAMSAPTTINIAKAGPLQRPAVVSGPSRPIGIVPVVVFGQNARRLPEAFAADHALDSAEVTRSHTASGLIQCGNAHGAGQLTLTDDVVTTAAHVFFDENGLPRSTSCNFTVSVNGRDLHVPIDLRSIVAGSTNPYNVAPADDWAVARLFRPMIGVKPYGIAADIHENEPVTFVARGHIDWGSARSLSMQDCLLHDQLSASSLGTREFSFDCDTGDGASGGALMFDRDYSRVGAILVGWRSNHPFSAMPYSRTHYNFAVTMEGAFRQAVYSAAGKMMVQK